MTIYKETRTTEFRDISLEKKFLGAIILDPSSFRKVIQSLDSHVFSSTKIKWIYEKAIQFYKKEGLIVTEKSFSLLLDMANQKRSIFKTIFKKAIKKAKKCDEAWIVAAKEKLIQNYKARLIVDCMNDAYKNLKKAKDGKDGKIEITVRSVQHLNDSLQVTETPVQVSNPIEGFELFEKTHKEIQKNPSKYMGVPTGIKDIDKFIKGLRPSEVGLITAATGKGKSILLLDIATSCWLKNGSVIFVTIEMPEVQVRDRFYCRLSGIEYDKFRNYMFEADDWKRMKRKIKSAKKNKNIFHIIDLPESSPVLTMKTEIENTIRKDNNVKLIVIDYLNIIKCSTGNVSLDYQKQIEVIIDIKQQISRYFRLPVWTANQVQGAKVEKIYLTQSDMAFAKNIADNVDVGIWFAEADDSGSGVMNGGFTKTRDFKGEGFQLTTNRNIMRFSVGKAKKAKTPMKRKVEGRKVKT